MFKRDFLDSRQAELQGAFYSSTTDAITILRFCFSLSPHSEDKRTY